MKKSAKIAETGLGSYIFRGYYGFAVGALPRQRDDFSATGGSACGMTVIPANVEIQKLLLILDSRLDRE